MKRLRLPIRRAAAVARPSATRPSASSGPRSASPHKVGLPAIFAVVGFVLVNPGPAPAALVDSGLSYADALVGETDALVQNVPRGSIGGGWHRAAPGATPVLSPTGYSTPMWHLRAFSAGNDYGHMGRDTNGVSIVGGADIPIDDQTLSAWRATLDNVRANGALVTPRFAYTDNDRSGCEPSDFAFVLAHIRQIAGVLNNYADVVPSIECGMIGLWGEMHTSKYVSPEYQTQLVRTWLDNLDPRIKVQVRSPVPLFQLFKKEVLGSTAASIDGETLLARLTELEDWERIGLYNDGYLGTVYDYGTFTDANGNSNFSREQANRWLKRLRDIPYGGEIATLTTDEQENTWPPFVQSGFNQVAEWYDCHLSYLRGTPDSMRVVRKMKQYTFTESAYSFSGMPSLSEWNGRNLLEFMRSHMGYRFVLRSSRLTDEAAPGGTLQLAFDVENTGFGDLFLPTRTEVLLQAADDRFWACPVALDLGAAVPSPERRSLSLSLRLPSAITGGTWRVYLRTHVVCEGDSPSAAGLRTVRFANAASQWSAALGANLLGSVRISGQAPQAGLDFRESGAAEAGATAPQLVLAALPAAAPTVPLSQWSGATLCLFAPGAANLRYFRAGVEVPAEGGAAALPAGEGALGVWSVRYESGGVAVSRDLFVVVPDGWEGRSWRLETRGGRLRAVCDETGEESDPAPGYDRALPGRETPGEPAANAKLVFAGTGQEFTADPATPVLYPAFVVSGLPAGGAKLGGLRSVTVSSGGGDAIDSNASGNLADRSNNPTGAASQRVPLAADGAYLTDVGFTLVNWIAPYSFGSVRSLALNDPTASRGGTSENLAGARLATLGLFQSDPGYHVWFCDEGWNVLCEKTGALAAGYSGSFHAIPIPAATNLYDGAAPAAASDDERCRPFRGWKNLDGTPPGWALGHVALVADYAEGEHAWEGFVDPATGAERLRCTVCGRERDGSFERTWRLETRGGVLRAVCAETGETAAPDAVEWDRGLPGRAIDAAPAANAKLVFASAGDEFAFDPAAPVVYPAFSVSGLPAGGGTLGGLRSLVKSSGNDTWIDSNNSGNLQSQAIALPADGAYLTDIDYKLVDWTEPYTFGTIRSLALNDPSASRGGRSAGLEGAMLAPLGLFQADPGYHVWFCDGSWNVLCEKSGSLAAGFAGNLHAIPVPAAAALFEGELPHREGTDQVCRRFVWTAPGGAAPGWALGDVALVGDWGEAPHDWTVEPDPATGGARLRCAVCGRERTVARPRIGGAAGAAGLAFDAAGRLAVRVPDAVAGAWYTLWAAPAVGGPWSAERASVRPESEDPLLFEGVDASPSARFLRVGFGDEPRAAGEEL